jgi:hypothetical protein
VAEEATSGTEISQARSTVAVACEMREAGWRLLQAAAAGARCAVQPLCIIDTWHRSHR